MAESTIEKLTEAHRNNPESIFSVFTLGGHVLSGRIGAITDTVTLIAGKEVAELPVERIEAFSYRPL